jgi:[amino group carrier protein]-lysine/ornithine hydrolase
MDDGEVLARLIDRYSPSGSEGAAVGEFVRLARELGYRGRTDRAGNGIAEIGRGRPVVLYLGHIDTVEGRRPARRSRGRIHGRGAVDAKGPLSAALLAGRGFPGPGTFRIVAAVGEETDSRGARYLARGRRPEALLVGEPSGWDGITIGYKGDVRLEATFRRRRSHWSSPHPTATDEAVDWLQQVRALCRERAGPSPFRSLTVKTVGFSSDPGADPEVARTIVDLRLPPGLTTSALLRALPGAPGAPSRRLLVRVEPAEVSRQEPTVLALEAEIRRAGGRPTLWRRTGSSDLNVVGPAWGLGGAAYGPGNARLDHTDRESLSIAELRRAARVIRGTLERLAAAPDRPATPRGSADAP